MRVTPVVCGLPYGADPGVLTKVRALQVVRLKFASMGDSRWASAFVLALNQGERAVRRKSLEL